jgi:hypothetical protein
MGYNLCYISSVCRSFKMLAFDIQMFFWPNDFNLTFPRFDGHP